MDNLDDALERVKKAYEEWQAAVSALDALAVKPIGVDPSEFHFHNPVQHRDGKPPWCKACGLTKNFETPKSRFGR